MALTGYRITEFIDVNPNSPTYNQTRQERTLDSECSPVAANWVELTSFCELDEHGKVTGYYIHVQVDQAEGSDTYGETREVKETAAQGQCVDAEDNPNWTIDPYYNSRCETKTYEPSMIVGDTGRYLTKLVDDNVYSPTYKTSVESALTESDWETLFSDPFPCETPNTQPDIEAISQYCETSGGTNTGYLIVNGMDKNPYSSTYLTVTSSKTYDEQSCPVSNCDRYGFIDQDYHLEAASGGGAVALSSVSADTLTFSRSKSSNWISFDSVQGGGLVNAYICAFEANNTGAERVGYAVFSSLDGCEFSGTVTQGTGTTAQTVEYSVVFAENNNPNVEYIMDLRFAFTNGSDERVYQTDRPIEGFRVHTQGKLYVDVGYTYNSVTTLAVNSGTPRPPSDLTVTCDDTSRTIIVKYTYTGNI